MPKEVKRKWDIDPDGVIISVKWSKLKVGNAVFIPCIDTTKAKEQLKDIAVKKSWEFTIQIRVEDGKLGLRIWRTVVLPLLYPRLTAGVFLLLKDVLVVLFQTT